MRDPVQVDLQLDQRRIGLLEDDVVSDLPVLLDELEVVIVIRELEPGLLDCVAGNVQPLGDDLELSIVRSPSSSSGQVMYACPSTWAPSMQRSTYRFRSSMLVDMNWFRS